MIASKAYTHSKLSTMKRYFLISTLFLACLFAVGNLMMANAVFTTEKENDFLKSLKAQFTKFYQKIPQERIYLQVDKTFYAPGETLWFSAYVRDAATMKASDKSDIIQVQLISPKGTIENTYKLVCKNGKAAGDFLFANDMPGGIYKLRAFSNWQKNEPDSLFFEKEIQVQDIVLPHLKMKLDFERKAYGQGDEVIAKLNLESMQNEPLNNYPFEYSVQLDGKEVNRIKAQTGNDGVMYVKFKLPNKLKSSDGLLNVVLNYEGSPESISRSIPIVRNNIALKFYPEGGDLVSNMPNKVAFKALNEFGKPADIEGEVYDSKGNLVLAFASYYQGMGAFVLPCAEGESYTAKILKPKGVEQEFLLPELLEKGYVLNVDNKNNSMLQVSVLAGANEELSLVAQVRGVIYYSTAVDAIKGETKVTIPVNIMPMGVCQVTLFDSKGIARCERLAFINKNKQLQVAIKTDKEKYQPREKVTASIEVKDENGMPVAAQLSLSVSNDELLSFANDKQGNLLSQLFLEQDVKGKIEEPAFYFTKEAKADQGLDYVMMTSGWRRFTWEPVTQNQVPYINYQAEKALVKGKVIDMYTGKPVTDAIVKLGKQQNQTNANGSFAFRKVDLSEPVKLIVEKQGYQKSELTIDEYSDNIAIQVINNNVMVNTVVGNRVQEEAEMGDQIQFAAPVMNARAEDIQPMALQAAVAPINAKATPAKKKEVQIVEKADKNIDAKNIAGPKMNNMAAGKAFFKAQLKDEMFDQNQLPINKIKYYRARQFETPDYSVKMNTQRSDFRKTIYWNPSIDIDKTGKKTIEFYASDEIASFRFVTEGIGANGAAAHTEKNIYTQLPFSMSVKFPEHLVQDDEVTIPLTLKNNTNKVMSGSIALLLPSQLVLHSKLASKISVAAGSTETILLAFKVGTSIENTKIQVAFKAEENEDAFEQLFSIHAKGFPVQVAFSGKQTDKAYYVDLHDVVQGSLVASATAYPSVVSDLMKGIESILREPSGCFEQTSMSSYPNILVREYMDAVGQNDPKLEAKTNELLEKGYKKLTSFETKEKGYEWFGGAPGHEALTAYGLLQFNDMKKVYPNVDQQMIDRTANWLMASKDGKGGYKRNPRALDNFGGANQAITNGYITYALACANYQEIKVELDNLYESAKESKDPYIMGLAANALFAYHKDKRAQTILNDLLKKQEANGSFMGSLHSITRSTDKALRVETTSLAIMAMLQSDDLKIDNLNKAIDFLIQSRNGNGDFGNSQSTIMALKALTKYANFAKQTNEDGVLEMYVNGKKVAEKAYQAGEREAIVLAGIEKYLGEGKNKLELKYRNAQHPLPYSIAVSWNTEVPLSSASCVVDLKTELNTKSSKVGEIVRLTAVLKNKSAEGLPNTMAIIGVPAGCSAQPWQLKEMMDKKLIDYYEINGNLLNIYYRQMAPNETKTLNFDLKAEVPGKFQAPASTAYLYYTNEYKDWEALPTLEIR